MPWHCCCCTRWAGWETSEVMLATALLGLISLAWAVAGTAMTVIPAWWSAWVSRVVQDPLGRFLLTQAMILGGLVLMLGSASLLGYWLWMPFGLLGVVNALALIGAPQPARERILQWLGRRPLWVHRVAGVMMVALATLLVIDTIRGGR